MGVTIEGPDDQRVVIHGVGKYGLKKPSRVYRLWQFRHIYALTGRFARSTIL